MCHPLRVPGEEDVTVSQTKLHAGSRVPVMGPFRQRNGWEESFRVSGGPSDLRLNL